MNKLKNKDEKSLFCHTKNYLIAELFNKGIIFLTIPIFTRLLLPEEYGIISIFGSVIMILNVIMSYNLNITVTRRYHEDYGEFDEFIGTNLIFLLVSNIFFILIAFLLKEQIASLFGIDSIIFFIAVIISALTCVVNIELFYLRASQNSQKYALITVVRGTVLTLGAILWMYLLKENRYLGRVYSQLVTMGFLFLYEMYNLIKISKFKFKLKHLKYSLLFGIPLIPHVFSDFILTQFDRIMINKIIGSGEAGLYSFAYSVGMILLVFIVALNNSWTPIFYKNLKEKKYNEIQNSIEKYSKIIFFIALGLILFSEEIVMLMASQNYYVALRIIPIIILANVAIYLYSLFSNYAFYRKKTGLISLFTFISGLTNIGLNYIFIPKYGYIAAAWTTLVSYVILFVSHYINSKYILKEKVIKLKKIMIDLGILLMIVIGYLSLNIDNYWIEFLVKFFLVTGFVAVVGLEEIKIFLKGNNINRVQK